MLLLGDIFPNFHANTTEGQIDFHDWLGDSWGILFSHPSDFTPVCTTELARVIKLVPEFTKRNVKVIGLSCDSISSHVEWCKDIMSYADCSDEVFPYPIIEDKSRELAVKLGMLDKDELDSAGIALTARAVFIVDTNKKFRLSILYPATTGRNFDEILRVLDSMQLTDKAKVATPVDWKVGDPCMVLPTVPEDQENQVFPQGVKAITVPSGKRYRQGRFQLSLETYLEANKLTKQQDPEICCALAECAWNLGETERGIEWARAGVKAGGGERAGALLARLLLACEDVQGAMAAYDQALTTQACGADTLAAAGALCLRADDPRRAFQLLGAALAQQPTQHAAALALAAMMLRHRDVDAALARLKAALTAHPTCVAAHTNLGLALLSKKKYVAGLTCLQRAVWTAPLSAGAAHNLGLVLLMCKRPTSAFCRLAAAAALHPTQPYTVLLIGVALERLNDSRADAAYVRAVALAPEDPLIRLNLAGRHARAGRLDKALEEALFTAQLLQKTEKPDPQLASSLATLMATLREAGVEVTNIPEELQERAADEREIGDTLHDEEHLLAADEV